MDFSSVALKSPFPWTPVMWHSSVAIVIPFVTSFAFIWVYINCRIRWEKYSAKAAFFELSLSSWDSTRHLRRVRKSLRTYVYVCTKYSSSKYVNEHPMVKTWVKLMCYMSCCNNVILLFSFQVSFTYHQVSCQNQCINKPDPKSGIRWMLFWSISGISVGILTVFL